MTGRGRNGRVRADGLEAGGKEFVSVQDTSLVQYE